MKVRKRERDRSVIFEQTSFRRDHTITHGQDKLSKKRNWQKKKLRMKRNWHWQVQMDKHISSKFVQETGDGDHEEKL